MLKSVPGYARLATIAFVLALGACGGGSSNSASPPPPAPPPPPPPTLDPQYRVSAASPFAANCDGVAAQGTLFVDAEVEPWLVVDPRDSRRLIGAWQQDRWSSGGARGLVVGASADGGRNWTRHSVPFTRCAGGNAENGGDYARASDPWLAIAPDGTAYVAGLAFDGFALQAGSVSAVLVGRSSDGGATWSAASALIRESGGATFNDKSSATADPVDAHLVYAVWDRVTSEDSGATWFTRTIDAGRTWEAPRAIYDPGAHGQTLGNIVAVVPNGTLVDLFTEIDTAVNGTTSAFLGVVRSTDNGLAWSAPFRIADELPVGTHDPETGAPVRDGSLVPAIAVGPGGSLFVVWQDARFSAGAHDGIAIARSDDGGFTWSAPTRVNSDAAVPAFVPAVDVRGDGMIGVTWYDFRADTADRSTLLTDYWLARSTDAANWHESQIAGPFDLAIAPLTDTPGESGYFLGDYAGLASAGDVFVPLFASTNAGDPTNRSDIFAAPAVSATAGAAAMASMQRAQHAKSETVPTVVSPELARRVSDNIRRVVAHRLPGLQERMRPQPRS
ncbi:MAG: sialidase family protein [Lysobacterales bacterium]